METPTARIQTSGGHNPKPRGLMPMHVAVNSQDNDQAYHSSVALIHFWIAECWSASFQPASRLYSTFQALFASNNHLIVIVNLRFVHRPQKRSCGNQLNRQGIKIQIVSQSVSQSGRQAGRQTVRRQAGRQLDGYGGWCLELRQRGRHQLEIRIGFVVEECFQCFDTLQHKFWNCTYQRQLIKQFE